MLIPLPLMLMITNRGWNWSAKRELVPAVLDFVPILFGGDNDTINGFREAKDQWGFGVTSVMSLYEPHVSENCATIPFCCENRKYRPSTDWRLLILAAVSIIAGGKGQHHRRERRWDPQRGHERDERGLRDRWARHVAGHYRVDRGGEKVVHRQSDAFFPLKASPFD